MRRRVRATPSRALKASHIPEPSARALCSVLRARELGGRGRVGAGGAVRGGETGLWLAGRPGKHLTPGCGCVCAAAVRVCFACALCLPPERDILLKAADDEAAAMIEETKASRQREYDDVVAKSVRRRPRPRPAPQLPLRNARFRAASNALPRLTVCRVGGAAIRRHQGDLGAGGRHAAADRQTFVQGAAEQVRNPPPPNFSKTLLLFLGLLCKRSRAEKC